jgi:hypothetical protein
MRAGVLAALLLALLLAAPLAAADHPGSNKGLRGLLGLPLDVTAPLDTNLVHRLPTVDAKMGAWEAAFPDFVERQTIGATSAGLPLYNVRVTDERVAFDAAPLSTGQKLRVYLDGGHHGNEYLGVELVMYYLEGLLTDAAAGDEAALDYLAKVEIYATPIINPTGNFADTRKNGNLVDVNRNYDFHWGEEGASDNVADFTYHGSAAESEPEVKANADFQREIHPDIVVTMHTGIAEFYWPWGWTHDPAPDDALFTSLEAPFENVTNGRVDAMQGAELYIVSGASDDWAYSELGAPGFTFEVHEDQFIPVYGEPIPAIISDQLAGLDWIVKNVRHIGAWVELRQDETGAWLAVNEGWGAATNVTILAGGETLVIPRIERDESFPVALDVEQGASWSYPALFIETTKTRTHTLDVATPATAPDTASVPAPGVALAAVALVGLALALRRR